MKNKIIVKVWKYIKDVFSFFFVGAFITFLYLFFCCSCSTIRPSNKEYLSLNEIQKYYGLTNKECKAINCDTIISYYHCGMDCRVYKYKP
jgi:hypothetical protein